MSDLLLLLGGGSTLYQPDALANFGAAGSAEGAQVCRVRVRAEFPAGVSGEVVFRRIHLHGRHAGAVAFYVTPVIDGCLAPDLRAFCSAAAPTSGGEGRFDFRIPLARAHPDYPSIALAPRGTSIELLIEAVAPAARWHLEDGVVACEPLTAMRGRGKGEA